MASFNNKNNPQVNLLFYMSNCRTCMVFINQAQKANILKSFKMICVDGQVEKFKSQGLKKVPTLILTSLNQRIEAGDCIKWLEEMTKFNNTSFGPSNEFYIPDVGLVNPNISQVNTNVGQLNPNIGLINPNKINKMDNIDVNEQITKLSTQINQLSGQLNNSNQNKNQFEVPKGNMIKRNALAPVQPPTPPQNMMGINNNPNRIIQNNTNQPTNTNGPVVKPVNQLFGYLQNEMSGFSDGYAYISVDNPLPKSFLPPDKDMEIYTAPEGDKIDKNKQEQMIRLVALERDKDKNQFKTTIDELATKIAMGDNNAMPKWLGSNKDL
jgi:hypothetical protein